MAFLGSFDISASGMSAQRVRMDIAAENIANMDTTRTESGGPYRRKNVLLESYSDTSFAQAMENAARGKGITSRHAGVRVSGIVEDDREAKKVYNPDHPDADADGYVTMPNVDVLKETVDSMSATRSYEANVTALNAIKLMAQKALEIGATEVINSGKEDALKKIEELTNGRGADVVFETAGSPVTIAQTPFIVRRGGVITLVGISAKEEINYNFAQIMDKEATIKSVFRYRNIYPKAIAAVSGGAINVKGIVTHEFDLDHIQEAYDEAVNNKTDLVKAVIKVK